MKFDKPPAQGSPCPPDSGSGSVCWPLGSKPPLFSSHTVFLGGFLLLLISQLLDSFFLCLLSPVHGVFIMVSPTFRLLHSFLELLHGVFSATFILPMRAEGCPARASPWSNEVSSSGRTGGEKVCLDLQIDELIIQPSQLNIKVPSRKTAAANHGTAVRSAVRAVQRVLRRGCSR